MKTTINELAVILSGILTSITTAYALYYLQWKTGFALHALSFWFAVPAGALLAGILAASGYAITARLLQYRPGRAVCHIALLVAIGSHILIYYFQYASLQVSGQPLSEVMSFGTFLHIVITHMKINVMGVASTGAIGPLGYLKAALQLAGFTYAAYRVCGVIGRIHTVPPARRECGKPRGCAGTQNILANAFVELPCRNQIRYLRGACGGVGHQLEARRSEIPRLNGSGPSKE